MNDIDLLMSIIGDTCNITDYSIVEDFSNDVKALSDLRSDAGAIVSLLDDLVYDLRFDVFEEIAQSMVTYEKFNMEAEEDAVHYQKKSIQSTDSLA